MFVKVWQVLLRRKGFPLSGISGRMPLGDSPWRCREFSILWSFLHSYIHIVQSQVQKNYSRRYLTTLGYKEIKSTQLI